MEKYQNKYLFIDEITLKIIVYHFVIFSKTRWVK